MCPQGTSCCVACDIVGCVVTAKTQYSLSNAQNYFAEHLAVGDYYQEGQKVAGEWFGFGAQSLGLNGKIREVDLLALCKNQNPQSGDSLTQRTNSIREQDGTTAASQRFKLTRECIRQIE